MAEYMVSLLMGVAVGVVYGFVQVRSPAPPLIALVGLLGMIVGEHAGTTARQYFAPTSVSMQQAAYDIAHSLRMDSDALPRRKNGMSKKLKEDES